MSWWNDIEDGIENGVTDAADWIKNSAEKIGQEIADFAKEVAQAVEGAVVAAAKAIYKFVQGLIQEVEDTAHKLWADVVKDLLGLLKHLTIPPGTRCGQKPDAAAKGLAATQDVLLKQLRSVDGDILRAVLAARAVKCLQDLAQAKLDAETYTDGYTLSALSLQQLSTLAGAAGSFEVKAVSVCRAGQAGKDGMTTYAGKIYDATQPKGGSSFGYVSGTPYKPENLSTTQTQVALWKTPPSATTGVRILFMIPKNLYPDFPISASAFFDPAGNIQGVMFGADANLLANEDIPYVAASFVWNCA